jgi:ribonuclease E
VQRAAAAAAPAPAAKAMPAVGAYVLSVDDMMGVAQAAGLQWVISDAHKVSQAQAAIANAPKPVHVPREPKPVVVMDSGPLVLVETRQDLRNTPLPF